MKRVISVLGLALAIGLSGQADAQTLKTVRDRGSLICGVSQGLPGFSSPDDKGNWTGLDVDFCRAIAAAIFNDPSKVKFTPLSAKDRFEPLRSSEIDVLSRNTTWTSSRDALFNFVGRDLLRRPGLHGAQGAQGEFGARAQRRQRLRPERHHHRAQSRGLLPRQQHEIRDRRVRHRGRDHQGLRVRPLRRVHHRRVAALCREAQAEQRQRPRDPAGGHLQGAARSAGAARRRPMVRRREVGAVCDAQCRRARRSPPRPSTRR